MYKQRLCLYFTVYLCALMVMTTVNADTISAEIYTKSCSVCHGERGNGKSHAAAGLNPPPKDFTVPGLKSRLSRESMIHTVSNGKPGTAMTSFSSQLSPAEISALVDYIRQQFMYDNVGKSILKNQGNDGKSIYAMTCSVCHGEDGAGATWGKSSFNPPPVNFTLMDKERDLPRERMINSVTNGRPNTAMTAFATQLDASEIEAVVDYIRGTFMIDSTTHNRPVGHNAKSNSHAVIAEHPTQSYAASTVGMAVLHDSSKESDSLQHTTDAQLFRQPISATLKGDAQAGMAYYLQNCTACHGSSGKGDGPRAYFIYPRPRNFLHPASQARFNRPELFKAIKQGVPGREMPAWGKVLNDQQIADITEYVFQTYIRPGDNAE